MQAPPPVMKHMADVVPAGIVSFDDDGKLHFVNDHLSKLLGYDKKELHGVHIEMLFTVSSKIFYQTHLFPLIKLHGKAEEVFLSLKAKDGTHIPVVANASEEDEIKYCVFIPVKQRRKYEDEILEAKRSAEEAIKKNETLNRLTDQLELQLAESERQLRLLKQVNTEYLYLNKVMSHDLHEPVRKLLMFIGLLKNNIADKTDQQLPYLEKMTNEAIRLRGLTMKLQQYVSIDLITEPLSAINIAEVATSFFEKLRKETSVDDATLTIDELPIVNGYRSKIEVLLREVLHNCFSFRKKDEPLRIKISGTTYRDNIYKEVSDKYKYVDYARIEVEDNGIGILPQYNEYIFDMFTRLNLATETSGFGLALCKKIVQRHNGFITAKPTQNGLKISIALPLGFD